MDVYSLAEGLRGCSKQDMHVRVCVDVCALKAGGWSQDERGQTVQPQDKLSPRPLLKKKSRSLHSACTLCDEVCVQGEGEGLGSSMCVAGF